MRKVLSTTCFKGLCSLWAYTGELESVSPDYMTFLAGDITEEQMFHFVAVADAVAYLGMTRDEVKYAYRLTGE